MPRSAVAAGIAYQHRTHSGLTILKIPMCRTDGPPDAVQATWITIHTKDLGQPTRRSWAAIHQLDSTTVVTQADGLLWSARGPDR